MDGCMDRWMDGWMDGWMHGWMDGWMDGWVNGGIGKKQMLSVHPSVTENPESDQSVTIQ